jgi:selenocysteine lyase/cysteine desulfurase
LRGNQKFCSGRREEAPINLKERNEPRDLGCYETHARASFYLDNTQAEVGRFVEVMKEIQKFFGQ